MVSPNTGNFTLTGMLAKRSLGARLEDHWISVKEFNAKGDGTTDDTAAIQAAFDFAYGAYGSEHGENAGGGRLGSGANKVVFFPAGRYKITAPLRVNLVWSPTLIGAGSHQSRIFFDPAHAPVASETFGAFPRDFTGIYPVIQFLTCWHVTVEGLTFDGSGVQNLIMHCGTHPAGVDDGHDGYYRDVHIKGAANIAGSSNGVAFTGAAMGSERTWTRCKFTNCAKYGYIITGGNTINHFFYGCVFSDNAFGLYQVGQGGSVSFIGCYSENNSTIDYYCGGDATSVKGCRSKSQNFLAIDGYIASNTHINSSVGNFLYNSNDGPLGLATGYKGATIVGNLSTNGNFDVDGGTYNYVNGNGTIPLPGVHLMGNVFGLPAPDYYAPALLRYKGSATIWIDGQQVNPPLHGTWNSLDKHLGITGNVLDLTSGKMVVTARGGNTSNSYLLATSPHVTTGKWYFEVTVTALPSAHWGVGVANTTTDQLDFTYFPGSSDGMGVTMTATGSNASGSAVFNSGTTYVFDTDPTISNGGVIGVAFDAAARKLWFRYNGTWLKGDPVAGTNGCSMTGTQNAVFPYATFRPTANPDGVLTLNLGATSFANAAPSGFTAWG